MHGHSNYPTIKEGSVEISKIIDEVENNQMYEMYDPKSREKIVKRVVAVPGDTVEVKVPSFHPGSGFPHPWRIRPRLELHPAAEASGFGAKGK